MQYILIAIVLMILCLSGWSCRNSTPANTSGQGDSQQITVIDDGPYMTQEQIKNQLIRISKKKPPRKLAMGAMCYKVAGPPDRIDFICPDCGEKTYYASEAQEDDTTRPYSRFVVWYLQEIDSYRRLTQQIDKLNVKLDESEFCRRCKPNVTEPQLAIIIQHTGRPEPHRVESEFIEMDLKILKAFNDDKLVFTLGNDSESTLQKHMDRLEELLGVKLDDTEQQ